MNYLILKFLSWNFGLQAHARNDKTREIDNTVVHTHRPERKATLNKFFFKKTAPCVYIKNLKQVIHKGFSKKS